MSKAYVATAENAQLVIAFNKEAPKALEMVAKKIAKMQKQDEWLMLTGVNVGYDDEGYYHVTATVSSVAF
jgi:sorbitol-specific phosphotransferase system component IIA